ncbi:unnamed protein product [Medioppia subpectinata]|uniref:RRM domain-containing protein n=1 Tax=Medioppia subpectinata TaxID=1979941 RepID=A0A7R9L1G5_9ACAR|nr:unnamed protein product [Medioppia subpectinata]CAD7633322.1 unnamed protein product [Medioppia subpectinata]CAG2113169.1 unnamed protein product [Medioppia subpectinata]CAG2113752.1 unnamed protein product [Medioppia subpectinata]
MSALRAARNLYVSGLPWTVGHRDLFEYFSAYGPIVYHSVAFDKTTGMSKRYGFVNFGHDEAIRAVLKQKTHVLDGNIINVEVKSDLRNNGTNYR